MIPASTTLHDGGAHTIALLCTKHSTSLTNGHATDKKPLARNVTRIAHAKSGFTAKPAVQPRFATFGGEPAILTLA